MRRRTLLSACGLALSGLAGCSSNTGEEETTPTETPEPTVVVNETPPRPGPVTFLSLQAKLVRVDRYAAELTRGEKSQYLYLDLDFTDEKPPARDEFTVEFSDRTIYPMAKGNTMSVLNNYGPQYTRHRGTGWLLFELPATGDATDARLRWPDGEWIPTERIKTRLAGEHPPFSVGLSIDRTISPGSVPSITVEMTNEGSIACRFVGSLNRAGPNSDATKPTETSGPISFPPASSKFVPVTGISEFVPAGKTKRIDLTESDESFDVPAEQRGDNEGDLYYWFDEPGSRSREIVRVEIKNEQ